MLLTVLNKEDLRPEMFLHFTHEEAGVRLALLCREFTTLSAQRRT